MRHAHTHRPGKRLMLAGLLAGLGFAAFAQTPPPPPEGGPRPTMRERMHRPDPAKMAEMHAKRQAELKAKLKITPAQEGAWNAYADATKPPAQPPARPDRAEFEKLTTPQRIEKMQAMKAQRDAEFAKRADATKTFYAALTPEQQKIFDTQPLHGPRGGHEHGGHGPRGGDHAHQPPAPKG